MEVRCVQDDEVHLLGGRGDRERGEEQGANQEDAEPHESDAR